MQSMSTSESASASACDCPACESPIGELRSQICEFEGTAQVLAGKLGTLKDKIHGRFVELNEQIALLRGDNDALRSAFQQLHAHPVQSVNMDLDQHQSSLPIFTSEMLKEAGIECAECAKLISEMSATASQRLPIRPTAIIPNDNDQRTELMQLGVPQQTTTQQLTTPSILQLSSILTPSPSPHRDPSITSPTSTIDSSTKTTKGKLGVKLASSVTEMIETPTSSASDKARAEQEYVNQAVISEFVRKRTVIKKDVGSQTLPNEKRLGTVIPTPSPAVSSEKIPLGARGPSPCLCAAPGPCSGSATSSLPRSAMRPPAFAFTRHTSESPNFARKYSELEAETGRETDAQLQQAAVQSCGKVPETADGCWMNICDETVMNSDTVVYLMCDGRALLYSTSADNYVVRNLHQLASADATTASSARNSNSRKVCLSDVDLPQPTDELLLHPANSSNFLLDQTQAQTQTRSRKTVRIVDANVTPKLAANCGYLYQLEAACPSPAKHKTPQQPHWHKYWFVLKGNTLFAFNVMLDTKSQAQVATESPVHSVTLQSDSNVELLSRDTARRVLRLTIESATGSRHIHLTDAPANMNHCDCPHCLPLTDWHNVLLRAVRGSNAVRVYSQLNRFHSDLVARNVRQTCVPVRVCGSDCFDSREQLYAFLLQRYVFFGWQPVGTSTSDVTQTLADCADLTRLELLCADRCSIAFWNRTTQNTFVLLFDTRDERLVAEWHQQTANLCAKFVQCEVVKAEQTGRESSASPQRASKSNGSSGSGSNSNSHAEKTQQNESRNWQRAASSSSGHLNVQDGHGQGSSSRITLEDQFLLAVLNEAHLFDTLTINTLDYVQTVRQKQLELSNLLDLLLCTPCSTSGMHSPGAGGANGNSSLMMHIAPNRKSVALLKRLCALCFEQPFLVDCVYRELLRCTATEFACASSSIQQEQLCRNANANASANSNGKREQSVAKDNSDNTNTPKRKHTSSTSASSLFAKLCSATSGQQSDKHSPSRVSADHNDMSAIVTRSWQLLALLTSVFTPRSRLLQRAVWIHLKRNANTATESGRYAQFCLKALRRAYGQALQCVYEPQTSPISAGSLQKTATNTNYRSPSNVRNKSQMHVQSSSSSSSTLRLQSNRKAPYLDERIEDESGKGKRRGETTTLTPTPMPTQRAHVPSSVEIRSLLLCNPLTYTTPLTVTVHFSHGADSLLSVAMPVSKTIGFDSFTTIGDIFNALQRSMQLRSAHVNGLTLCCVFPNGDWHSLPHEYILADVISRVEQLSETNTGAGTGTGTGEVANGSMCTSMTQSQISFANGDSTPTLQCRVCTFRPADWSFESQSSETERLIVVESVIDSLINCPVRCWTFAALSSLVGKYSRAVCSMALLQGRLEIQRVYSCCKTLLSRLRDSGKLHSHELSFLRKCINDVLTTVMTKHDTSTPQLPSMTLDDMLSTIIEWPNFTAQWFPVSHLRVLAPGQTCKSLASTGNDSLHVSVCFQNVSVWNSPGYRQTDGNSARPILVCNVHEISAFGKCRLNQDAQGHEQAQGQPQLFISVQRDSRNNVIACNNMSISTYDNGSNYGLVQVCNANYVEHSCYPQAVLEQDSNPFYVVLSMNTNHDVCRALGVIQRYAELASSACGASL